MRSGRTDLPSLVTVENDDNDMGMSKLDRHHDIDRDMNFYCKIDNCKYYSIDQFNDSIGIDQSALSIIHFNSRSLKKNFQDIKDILGASKKRFSVVAISESWGILECAQDYELEGYELHFINGVNKRGGGVALYVDRRLHHKVVESLSIAHENVCKSITIEVDMGKLKNILISCIYRAPGYSMDNFKELMVEMYSKTEQKVTYECGDFNIDFLNPNKIL